MCAIIDNRTESNYLEIYVKDIYLWVRGFNLLGINFAFS
jgi:hypothetical protein